MKKVLLPFIFFLATASTAWAQKVIKGTVRDAQTGQTLPATNIIIKGTYRGTITNSDGEYSLSIPDSLLPATVQVRYIGFTSQERKVTIDASGTQDFALSPSVSQMEEMVVSDQDPGMSIMERVIKRKQQWSQKLHSYQADAYTRQTLANDTSLVMITETTSISYWDRQKGHREIIKSRRQTANISAADNLTGARYIPNFYDDNIDLLGYKMVGVTNPDALKYYRFKLVGQTTMDNQQVYKIKVIPARKLQPLFKGMVYVLDKKYAMLKVQLKPNDVVKFPPPVKSLASTYEQQYNNFGHDFWLPVDMRISGQLKIGMVGLKFPRMQFRYLSKLANYRVNVLLPDSLYNAENTVRVDSSTIRTDSLITKSIEPVPLSDQEEHAYATLDSTQTLEKAFKPHGFLARFVDVSDDDSSQTHHSSGWLSSLQIPGEVEPRLRYNRVEELFGGLSYAIYPFPALKLEINGGYSTGTNDWSDGARMEYRWSAGRFKSHISGTYFNDTKARYTSQIISPVLSSIPNVLGYENYFDYFREKGFNLSAGVRDSRSNLSVQIGFNSGNQTSLKTNTGYDILGQNRAVQINPPINEGRLNSLELKTGYNLDEAYTFGITGRKRIAFDIEYSDPGLGSDFNFTRYTTHIDWSFDTFYQRRLFPNTLNVSFDAGTFSGQLPLQKFGIVDGSPGIINFFGGLRTLRFRPYEGEQYAAINLEHNFRTVPFELLGLRPLVKHNIGLIVFGGVAQTCVSDQRKQQLFNRSDYLPNTTDGTHIEAGISLNGIFNLFRVNFAQRLDEPAFLISVGITRFY